MDVGNRAGALLDASAGPLVVDAPYIRHWIHYRYQACGFQRYLSDSDMKVRALHVLGVRCGVVGCTPLQTPLTPPRNLVLLKKHSVFQETDSWHRAVLTLGPG